MTKPEAQTPPETPSLVRAHDGERKGRKILLGESATGTRKIRGEEPDDALLLRRV